MKIVIDYSEKHYESLKNLLIPTLEERAILNGTVLPKGHGDLKDMNDLCYKSRYGCKGNCDYLHTCDLYDAPTIIEADKAESEDAE